MHYVRQSAAACYTCIGWVCEIPDPATKRAAAYLMCLSPGSHSSSSSAVPAASAIRLACVNTAPEQQKTTACPAVSHLGSDNPRCELHMQDQLHTTLGGCMPVAWLVRVHSAQVAVTKPAAYPWVCLLCLMCSRWWQCHWGEVVRGPVDGGGPMTQPAYHKAGRQLLHSQSPPTNTV